MAVNFIDEAKTWVATHQQIDLTKHRYTCPDPFDGTLVHSSKSTGELILRIALSYQNEASNLWRRRLGVRDF